MTLAGLPALVFSSQRDIPRAENVWPKAPYSGKWVTYTTSADSTHYVHANATDPAQACSTPRARLLTPAFGKLRSISEHECFEHELTSF